MLCRFQLFRSLVPSMRRELVACKLHSSTSRGISGQSHGTDRRQNCAFAASLAVAGSAAVLALKAAGASAASVVKDDRSHELSADEQRTVALFERCSGSVVHINTFVQKPNLVRSLQGFHMSLQEIPQGTGSGFVWDAQHIVTNYHVIKDADKATVVLSDHTAVEAKLVGAEPDCDLAVLRVLPSEGGSRSLVPLVHGTSRTLQVGQKVLAIGNPFGLDQTLTSGIVSGLGREMRGLTGRPMRGLIQIDAAINPGNSGGPLLDSRGRLIGVNAMIASPSGAFAGVGFAIPVDTVLRVVQQIIKFGHVKYAFMGVALAPDATARTLSRRLEQAGLPALQGALVLNVEPGSPAEKAGLKPTLTTTSGLVLGDDIISIDGKQVLCNEDLMASLESHAAGDELDVVYNRRSANGREINTVSCRIRLMERPWLRAFRDVGLEDDEPKLRSRM